MSERIRGTCKHCGRPDMQFQARGLCSNCYRIPWLRRKYPHLRRKSSGAPPCRACGRWPGGRAEGLCWKCFADPWIVQEFAPGSPGHAGVVEGDDGPWDNPPGAPSPVPPWDERFFDIAAERVRLRLPVVLATDRGKVDLR